MLSLLRLWLSLWRDNSREGNITQSLSAGAVQENSTVPSVILVLYNLLKT
jgi:hypothetical protein